MRPASAPFTAIARRSARILALILTHADNPAAPAVPDAFPRMAPVLRLGVSASSGPLPAIPDHRVFPGTRRSLHRSSPTQAGSISFPPYRSTPSAGPCRLWAAHCCHDMGIRARGRVPDEAIYLADARFALAQPNFVRQQGDAAPNRVKLTCACRTMRTCQRRDGPQEDCRTKYDYYSAKYDNSAESGDWRVLSWLKCFVFGFVVMPAGI